MAYKLSASLKQLMKVITILLSLMTPKQKLIDLFIRLPNGNGCQLTLPSSTSLRDLASRLEDTSMNLPESYRIVYRGERVKDYALTLSELGVQANGILHLEPLTINLGPSLKIDVAFLLDGDKFVVKISREETIWSLKTAIFNLSGLSPKDQLLVFLGRKLKNHQTLNYYKIGSDSLLSLVLVQFPETCTSQLRQRPSTSQGDLMSSVFSLLQRKSGMSATTLFRSDSINRRNAEEITPIEIAIRDKKYQTRELFPMASLFELFSSVRGSNELKNSINFDSLCDSVGLTNRLDPQGGEEEEANQCGQKWAEVCEKQGLAELRNSFVLSQEQIVII